MNQEQYDELKQEDIIDLIDPEYFDKCLGQDNCEGCSRYLDDCDGVEE